jgi:two-component system OmpR family response regulator
MGKKKILIVDDEQDFLKLAQAHLKKTNNYEVRVESNGNIALPVALEFKPDLILLDIVMPEVDGGEVASQIKSNNELKDVPLVFLTSLVRKEETATRDKFLDKQNFIEKMVRKEELVSCIEGLFRRGGK